MECGSLGEVDWNDFGDDLSGGGRKLECGSLGGVGWND